MTPNEKRNLKMFTDAMLSEINEIIRKKDDEIRKADERAAAEAARADRAEALLAEALAEIKRLKSGQAVFFS